MCIYIYYVYNIPTDRNTVTYLRWDLAEHQRHDPKINQVRSRLRCSIWVTKSAEQANGGAPPGAHRSGERN